MTYDLHFLPEVAEEVIGGYVWYEGKSPGLGDEFLRIFFAGAGEIKQNPLLSPKVHNEFRRRLLRRFPYAIYFVIKDDQIIVFGLFHCARDPRTIRTKLGTREEPKKS
jgi:toxin ParE1/3/4